jgi:hypothetical protein
MLSNAVVEYIATEVTKSSGHNPGGGGALLSVQDGAGALPAYVAPGSAAVDVVPLASV